MWFGGGEGVAFARGQGCRCSFSAVHYFGAILKGPKACTLIHRVQRAPASRAEAESLQKPSRSLAPELAAALPAVPRVLCSLGSGGSPRRQGAARDRVDTSAPGRLPRKSKPCLGLLFQARLSGWPYGHLGPVAELIPSTGTMSMCLHPQSQQLCRAGAVIIPVSQMKKQR